MKWYQLTHADHWQPHPVHQDVAAIERGWSYGDGFFTTMAIKQDIVLRAYHAKRIHQHCRSLCLTWQTWQTQSLLSTVLDMATAQQYNLAKLTFIRPKQPARGYGMSLQAEHNRPVVYLGLGQYKQTKGPIHAVCLKSALTTPTPALVGLKTLNRLDSVLASNELAKHARGIPSLKEGLVQNLSSDWVEGTKSNVFYRLSKEVYYTPPVDLGGVAGVLRAALLDQQQVVERPLQNDDLPKLKGLWFGNAIQGCLPVSRLYLTTDDFIDLKSLQCSFHNARF